MTMVNNNRNREGSFLARYHPYIYIKCITSTNTVYSGETKYWHCKKDESSPLSICRQGQPFAVGNTAMRTAQTSSKNVKKWMYYKIGLCKMLFASVTFTCIDTLCFYPSDFKWSLRNCNSHSNSHSNSNSMCIVIVM